MTSKLLLRQDKESVLTPEEKKLLDQSYENERAHKTLSSTALRKKLASCTK